MRFLAFSERLSTAQIGGMKDGDSYRNDCKTE
jgi:hypothetical protein